MNIRNFCIIAHIDHGKSTLADRLIEYTNTVSSIQMKPQIMDDMELEQERGITIRSKTVQLNYHSEDGKEYVLNLIDTPGHVDFSYEVQRAFIASEGALLLVDASQGVEAQTLANTYLARRHNLKIIPMINKIDLPTADVLNTRKQVRDILEIENEPLLISAKEGIGIENVLESIVKEIPEPKGDILSPLKAIVFDSFYDSYRGIVVYVRVFDGKIIPDMKIVLHSNGKVYEVLELGILKLKMFPTSELIAGDVGYIICGIKNIHDVKIGDTIYEKDKPQYKIESKLSETKPYVFAGVFPINPGDYENLRLSIEKLHLTDASFVYSPTNSNALGAGFHSGFLGTLHLEIVKERLEREFKANLLVTTPNVKHRVKLKGNSSILEIDNPSKMPSSDKIEFIEEPFVKSTIISPNEYISSIIELCKNVHRAKVIEVKQPSPNKSLLIFEMPLSEIISGFYDTLKSVSRGYASFDYENIGYRKSNLVKLEILINHEVIDAFSYIVHEDKVEKVAKCLIEKLRTTIPRHLFQIPLQIKADSRIVARDDIKSLRKDVIAKLYGGDVTRKRKLLEKQKTGKKKMKQFGKVEIPQETFIALLRIE